MRRSASRSRDVALGAVAALAALATPAVARAQACCAGASAIGTARLAPHEDAVAGVGARATALYGSLDAAGRFVPSPSGAMELDLEQDIVGTVRVLRHGQLTAIAPFIETYRAAGGRSEMGYGIGDVRLGARYDFIEPGASATWPGVALSFGLTLPTGRSPEAATLPLATDATGTGSAQASAQIALERGVGDRFFLVSGSAEWRSPRFVNGLHVQRGPALTAFGAAGTSFKSGAVAALTLSYTAELKGRLEGAPVPDSGHELLRAGLAVGYAFSDEWRMQLGLTGDLPVGRGQPLGVGLSVMLLRGGD